ncbi:hypothetical protein J2Z48_000640 [Croceifilum oryzae]|uniref:Uncharacterized protein n=1 Tax=Croceifilum oryzae TaxID=1553429 RepID=A0AAJ1TKQ2_9BACL|nr:hypothetical protein [Croceifilum oryzae]
MKLSSRLANEVLKVHSLKQLDQFDSFKGDDDEPPVR